MKSARYERWVACGDNHGDLSDPVTERAFFEFLEYFKPRRRIHGGDCFDLRWLRGRASEQEKREKTQDDFDAGTTFLKRFKPDTFLTGNHDHRLWRAARADDGKLAQFACLLIMEIKDALGDACVLLPYGKREGVHGFGDHKVVHGYHTGLYAVRNAASIYGNVLMFHIHASDQYRAPGIDARVGHSSGSLCKTDLDYNEGQPNTLRQSNGWLYGFRHLTTNRLTVCHADRTSDGFYLPTEFKEFRGEKQNAKRDG